MLLSLTWYILIASKYWSSYMYWKQPYF